MKIEVRFNFTVNNKSTFWHQEGGLCCWEMTRSLSDIAWIEWRTYLIYNIVCNVNRVLSDKLLGISNNVSRRISGTKDLWKLIHTDDMISTLGRMDRVMVAFWPSRPYLLRRLLLYSIPKISTAVEPLHSNIRVFCSQQTYLVLYSAFLWEF